MNSEFRILNSVVFAVDQGNYTAAMEGCCSATAVSAGPRRMIDAIES